MEVEILSSTILKAFASDYSTNIWVPLTIFDLAAYNAQFAGLYAFHGPMPSNEELKDGLSKTLNSFPALCGRISSGDSRRPGILLNNAGMKLNEARTQALLCTIFPDGATESYVADQPAEVSLLYPPISDTEELLQIQITRFSCGGVVLGATAHHYVIDGQSWSIFFSMWANIVRGSGRNEFFPTYDINRAALLVPRKLPTCPFNHHEIEFTLINAATQIMLGSWDPIPDLKNVIVEFSPCFIAELKAMVKGKCSTFECIVAHLWKKITLARKVKGEEITRVKVAVNGRTKTRLDMPKFFGNMVLYAFPSLKVEGLLSGSLTDTVKAIHEAVATVNHEYFTSFIDFGKIMEGREDELLSNMMLAGNRHNPGIEVHSLVSFNGIEIEFTDGNKPHALIMPDLSEDGLIMLASSCKEKGGVVAFLALLKDDAEEFKKTCFKLEY